MLLASRSLSLFGAAGIVTVALGALERGTLCAMLDQVRSTAIAEVSPLVTDCFVSHSVPVELYLLMSVRHSNSTSSR